MGLLNKIPFRIVSVNKGPTITISAEEFMRKFAQAYVCSQKSIIETNKKQCGTKNSEAQLTAIQDNLSEVLMLDVATELFGEKATEDALNTILNDRELQTT